MIMESPYSENETLQNSFEPINNELKSEKGFINASNVPIEPNRDVSDILTNETSFDQKLKFLLAKKECKKYIWNISILIIAFLSILFLEYFLSSSLIKYFYYSSITASIFIIITTTMFFYSYYTMKNSNYQHQYSLSLYIIGFIMLILTIFYNKLLKIYATKS